MKCKLLCLDFCFHLVCLVEFVVAVLFQVMGRAFRGRKVTAAAVRGGKRTWQPNSTDHLRRRRRQGKYWRRVSLIMLLLCGDIVANLFQMDSDLRHLQSQRAHAPSDRGGFSRQGSAKSTKEDYTDFRCTCISLGVCGGSCPYAGKESQSDHGDTAVVAPPLAMESRSDTPKVRLCSRPLSWRDTRPCQESGGLR